MAASVFFYQLETVEDPEIVEKFELQNHLVVWSYTYRAWRQGSIAAVGLLRRGGLWSELSGEAEISVPEGVKRQP
jgi:hypothetical protein